jgi:hypothetical protein
MSISAPPALRQLWKRKPAISAAPATIGAHDLNCPKPPLDDSASPKISKVRPGDSSAIPSQSSRCAGCGLSFSSTMKARVTARMPIGTLIRKIQRQETSSTSQPPRIGPMIGAISIGTPRMPITRPIRLGPAFLVMIVMTTGMIMPPPMPCRTRKAISESALQATAQRAEPSMKRSSEEM